MLASRGLCSLLLVSLPVSAVLKKPWKLTINRISDVESFQAGSKQRWHRQCLLDLGFDLSALDLGNIAQRRFEIVSFSIR